MNNIFQTHCLDTKCNLKYKHLSSIDNKLLSQINLVFITTFKANNPDIIIITKSDDVYAFGPNGNARQGFGTTSAVVEPTLVPELCDKGIKNILIRQQFGIGLTQSGDVYTWGYDYMGLLGLGQSNTYMKPTKLSVDTMSDTISKIDCTYSSIGFAFS